MENAGYRDYSVFENMDVALADLGNRSVFH
jgi:hypothetical protein